MAVPGPLLMNGIGRLRVAVKAAIRKRFWEPWREATWDTHPFKTQILYCWIYDIKLYIHCIVYQHDHHDLCINHGWLHTLHHFVFLYWVSFIFFIHKTSKTQVLMDFSWFFYGEKPSPNPTSQLPVRAQAEPPAWARSTLGICTCHDNPLE